MNEEVFKVLWMDVATGALRTFEFTHFDEEIKSILDTKPTDGG